MFSCITLQAEMVRIDLPCIGTTKTRLNIRTGPSTGYPRVTTMPKGATLRVVKNVDNVWVQVEWNGYTGYANTSYMTYTPIEQPSTSHRYGSGSNSSDFTIWSLIGWCFKLLVLVVAICIGYEVLKIGLKGLFVATMIAGFILYITSWPFWWLNAIQRYLSRPWSFFLKRNTLEEDTKEFMRDWIWVVQVPLYIALTPVRFVCAFYFNMVLHLLFEIMNMIVETVTPSKDSEGGEGRWRWVVMLPVRILKYPIIHVALSGIESAVWTLVDTLLPALTLYHGTSGDSAENIVTKSSGYYKFNKKGHWWVGGGNWAGDGIYFAPIRSTANHYSEDVVIVCRVTTGKILDLGLAPWRVYRECGNANAHGVTKWGLNNNYVTGLWWRSDCSWWEYCLYDRGNRYNESWRIRPLYVINSGDHFVRPISGGMRHWLFDSQVIWDLKYTLKRILDD
jgi:hypothetical protein